MGAGQVAVVTPRGHRRRSPTSRWAYAFLSLLSLSLWSAGCGSSLRVTARELEPAQIPLRAFPHVWIESGQLHAEQHIAAALARHLDQTPHLHVRLLDRDAIAAARAAGTIPAASVVVVLRLSTQESARLESTFRPRSVCDALGCYSVSNPQSVSVPVLDGQLEITVQSGPSGQVVQQLMLRERQEWRNYDEMQERMVEVFAHRLTQVTAQRLRTLEVTLLEVDHPDISQALLLAERGDWVGARAVLEQVVSTGALASLDARDQARVHYNLAHARRFGVRDVEDGTAVLRLALADLDRAAALDTDERYLRAKGQFQAALAARQVVDDQRAAAAANFAVDEPVTGAPMETP